MTTTPSTSNATPTARDVAAPSAVPATHTTYRIDPQASRVEFSIGKRLFFVKKLTVTGRFSAVEGTITLDEQNPSTAQAVVAIDAASIDTGHAQRDKHLRKVDFFHVDQYPTLTFHGRRVEPIDPAAGRYRVVGDLTVRNVTREVTLDTHYALALGARHDHRMALTLTTTLNRRDFGMVWNKPVLHITDDLTVTLAIEATRV